MSDETTCATWCGAVHCRDSHVRGCRNHEKHVDHSICFCTVGCLNAGKPLHPASPVTPVPTPSMLVVFPKLRATPYRVSRYRVDGWPICPHCDQDELYCFGSRGTKDIVGCYRCGPCSVQTVESAPPPETGRWGTPPEVCTHPHLNMDGECKSCGKKVGLAVPVAFAKRMREIEEGKFPPMCVVEPPAPPSPGSRHFTDSLPSPWPGDAAEAKPLSRFAVFALMHDPAKNPSQRGDVVWAELERLRRDLAEARAALASSQATVEQLRQEIGGGDIYRHERDDLRARLAVTVGALERIAADWETEVETSPGETEKICKWCACGEPHDDDCIAGIARAALTPPTPLPGKPKESE